LEAKMLADADNNFKTALRRNFIVLSLLAAVLLIIRLWSPALALGGVNYLPLHMLLETLSIVVAGMVFIQGWFNPHGQTALRVQLLALLFLGVAVLDFSHMLSFAGMPDFVTPSDPQKAINFWLAARFLAAIALLLIAFMSELKSARDLRYWLLFALALFLSLVHYWFLFAAETVPVTYQEDSGLTLFKVVSEYVLVALYGIAATALFLQSLEHRRTDRAALAAAAAVLAMAELFFTFYATVTDVFNLLGHVYKVVAYAYLYQALVVTGVTLPFRELEATRSRLKATVDAIPDMVFEVSPDGILHAYYSEQAKAGLLMDPEAFLGHNFREFLPPAAIAVVDAAYTEIAQKGQTAGHVYSLQLPDGEHWFEISGSRINNPGGAERYLTVTRDITVRERAQRALARNSRILKATLDNLPVGVAVNTVGAEVKFDYMNDNFARFYRTSRQALESSSDFWSLVYEDEIDRETIKQRVLRDFERGDAELMRWENVPVRRQGQELRYVTAQNVPVPGEGLSVSLVEDVTERLLNEQELRIAATAFSSQEGIMITDANQRILRVNKAFEKTTGYTQDEVLDKAPSILGSGMHDREFYAAMWRSLAETDTWHGEIWNRRKSGEIYPQSLTITAVKNELNIVTHYVADFIDISDIKHAQAEISRLSFFDPLTGLPNRARFQELLQETLDRCRESGRFGALLLVDLDHFKTINDTIGHASGDKLLEQVAGRLNGLMRDHYVVARYGGDEFVVIMDQLELDPAGSATYAQQMSIAILNALDDRYQIDGDSYDTTCSIGVALFGQDTKDTADIMKQVDIALFQAKNAGRNTISFFDPDWQEAVKQRALLLKQLKDGLLEKQFVLFFQPQVGEHGELIGAEALVRWRHPDRGIVCPAEFIPLAEHSGMMLALGDEVLHMGLQQLSKWQTQQGYKNFKLSINLATEQFYAEGFVEHLESLLDQLGIDANHLMLEFTESVLMENLEEARSLIGRLSKRGVRFAIDDFGTGYSSLAYLSRLALDQLKIDQSFVRNMAVNPKDAAIVRAIIEMARTLDIEVIAEGVETADQRDYLLECGCHNFQGYFFGRPVPAEEFSLDRAVAVSGGY
jgi:diguanylate cyclase (GGDEF)-like protein/PAS domain S-box-containing protein